MWEKAVCRRGKSNLPAGVSAIDRTCRSKSLTPSNSSSPRIWWLSAPAVTCNSCAALVTLRWRAAASNAWRALSGGIGLCMRYAQPSGENISIVERFINGRTCIYQKSTVEKHSIWQPEPRWRSTHESCSKLQGFWLLLQGQGFYQEQSRRKQARHTAAHLRRYF